MMVDRFATERLAAERFTTMQQGIEERMNTQQVADTGGKPMGARVARLVAVAALALTLLGGGLLSHGGEALADSAGGGAAVAEGIGYVP